MHFKFYKRTPKYSLFLSLFFLFTTSLALAQEDYKPKFGVIDVKSLLEKPTGIDSTADAMYLYDCGDVRFSYSDIKGLVMIQDIWVRIKILKPSALSRASVSLEVHDVSTAGYSERIDDLKAFTHNLDQNKITSVPLDKKAVVHEKSSSDFTTIKFNLSNVKVGSVIEYSYSRITPFKYKSKPESWVFQGKIPSKWSEYRIAIPYFLQYKMTMYGYLPLHINKEEKQTIHVGLKEYDGNGLVYRFVVKDAPAFIEEPYMTATSDYLSKIDFELASMTVPGSMTKRYSQTWEQVDRTLMEVPWFGGELRKASYLKEVHEKIKGLSNDPLERMQHAYQYIQNSLKWDGYNGVGSKQGVKKAFETKQGNVSDLNLLLVLLLRELDLDANPVVLSTRTNGRINEEIPSFDGFNYVIAHVQVGEKEYILDASQPYGKPGILPENALNGTGRMILPKGAGKFIDLEPKESLAKLEMIQATISAEDGEIKGNYNLSMSGYEALRWRNQFAKAEAVTFQEQVKKQAPEWIIQDISIKNKTDNLATAVGVSYNFEIENVMPSAGMFYFNPILAGRWTENPLKSPTRIYPLNLPTGTSSTYIGNFTIPEGYVIEDLPKPIIITLPENGGKFIYAVKQQGRVLQVNSTILISKLYYSSEDYLNLREFFELIVQKHAQPLTIKKI